MIIQHWSGWFHAFHKNCILQSWQCSCIFVAFHANNFINNLGYGSWFSHAVCEQAYTMAQNLDPSSEGRGVLQFKTGLMSVIKVIDRILLLFFYCNDIRQLTQSAIRYSCQSLYFPCTTICWFDMKYDSKNVLEKMEHHLIVNMILNICGNFTNGLRGIVELMISKRSKRDRENQEPIVQSMLFSFCFTFKGLIIYSPMLCLTTEDQFVLLVWEYFVPLFFYNMFVHFNILVIWMLY